MSQLDNQVLAMISTGVMNHPEVWKLKNEIAALREEIAKMRSCCLCIKMQSPPDKEAEFAG